MNPEIYYFSHYTPSAACVRYRGKYLLENLHKTKEIKYHFIYPEYSVKMMTQFLFVVFNIIFTKKKGLIICQKIYRPGLFSKILYYLIRYSGTKSLYDIDDAYYVNYGEVVINKFISASNGVITGSEALLQYAKKLNPNSKKIASSVIRQSVEIKLKPDKLTIGFVGSVNYYLPVLMEQVFPAILEINIPAKLVVLGINREYHPKMITDYFQKKSNIEVIIPEIKNWENEALIYNWIKTFTIGLSPLTNSIIDNSKSAFKMKQYLSCGVPVLGSDIGENKSLINHFKNGLICNSKNEYINAIKFIEQMDDIEYEKLQITALESVKSYYYDSYVNSYWDSILSITEETNSP